MPWVQNYFRLCQERKRLGTPNHPSGYGPDPSTKVITKEEIINALKNRESNGPPGRVAESETKNTDRKELIKDPGGISIQRASSFFNSRTQRAPSYQAVASAHLLVRTLYRMARKRDVMARSGDFDKSIACHFA